MQRRRGFYDPGLLAAVSASNNGAPRGTVDAANLSVSVKSKDLAPGMVLRSNVETRDGTLILCAGHQLNDMTLEKIRNFERVAGIKEPILVENTGAVHA
jgi:hypothetical protein